MTPENSPQPQELLRKLPQVEKLLSSSNAASILKKHPRLEVVRVLRGTLEDLRAEIQSYLKPENKGNGAFNAALESLKERIQPESLLSSTQLRLENRERPHYRRIVNATGIILHTGLGRAVLPRQAIDALSSTLGGYSLVEVDADSGERNRREGFLAELLCELTGAEAATVVNNNAGATLIILAALARNKEVVISRGQLVEIGGSFRIPSIMEESGAFLVEVGTTNRTYVDDYRRAIRTYVDDYRRAMGPETGLLLKVHTSNYEIMGFAHHTPLEELVALGQEMGIPVVSDLGSGCFVDLSESCIHQKGFRREPLVSESIKAGADLVCFSGDKLLGGPQAGIIVGKKEAVEKVRKHSLFRALRIDKMVLIALEASLRLYRDPTTLHQELPVLKMLTQPEDEVKQRAKQFRDSLVEKTRDTSAKGLSIELMRSTSQTGSGSLPTQELPTWTAAIKLDGMPPDQLADALRRADPPIFTRIQNNLVLIDFRTLLAGEEKWIQEALEGIPGH